jgi:hypothetical protein
MMGWRLLQDRYAPVQPARSFVQAKDGRASLELGIDSPDSDVQVAVDMRYNLPIGIATPAPYDLTDTTITCWVYAPLGSAGAIDSPNGFQIFVEDANFIRKEGPWIDITSEREDTWFPITLALNIQEPPGGNRYYKFDPTRIILLGVKISASEGQMQYEGSILLDACDW